MSFWSENYSFIKEVYDTRVNKMVEWMDQVEIAITKVMATKVYTSAEFKRERDNFLSLIKNLEKGETKKWLDEVKETLFKDRAGDERKEEHQRLEAVIERHQTLIPRVHETQVKSEVSLHIYINDILLFCRIKYSVAKYQLLEMDCQKNILNFLLCFYRIIIKFPVSNHIFVQHCTIAAPSPCSLHPQLDPTIQLNLTEGQGQDLVNQSLYFSNIS